MAQRQYFKNKIFQTSSSKEFEKLSLELFLYQYENNTVYKNYVQHLGVNPTDVKALESIPFLPIEFFKSKKVKTNPFESEKEFSSSGTTSAQTSKHFIRELNLYIESFSKGLQHFYPSWEDRCVLALLPSYLEREGSSLVYMADYLIKNSKDEDSGFYLDKLDELSAVLKRKSDEGKKVLLLGVTFALLDLAASFPQELKNIVVMETGGMKGRRKEMIREEVHGLLKQAFGLDRIHSEYGMTELLSQAYSLGNGRFTCPPWMKVIIRETNDPFSMNISAKTGGVNVVDLANLDSCAFIETKDLGRKHTDGSFEIMGRFDNSDIRGCNLMVF